MKSSLTSPHFHGNGTSISETATEFDVMKMRDQRIHDYLVASLGQADALHANLGAVSADLMSMAHRLKQAIDQAMGDCDNSVACLAKWTSALEGYLRLNRQLGRFLDLEKRLRDSEKPRSVTPR